MNAGNRLTRVESDVCQLGPRRQRRAQAFAALLPFVGFIATGFLTVGTASAATILVSTAGDDANDGLTWPTAKRTIQAGLNAAASGDQVWVSRGNFAERVTIPSGVELYGGLSGNEDPALFDLNFRKLDTNRTRIGGANIQNGSPTTRIDGFLLIGGGIQVRFGAARIVNNIVKGSSRALDILGANVEITNNWLMGNYWAVFAGVTTGSVVRIVNNTIIASNYALTTLGSNLGLVTVDNSIFAFNRGVISGSGVPITFANNCFYGNEVVSPPGSINPDPTGTQGNFAADPRLAANAYGNMHLLPDSPCIDAAAAPSVAIPVIDIDGQQRVQGAGLDIGADESDGSDWSTGPPRIARVTQMGDDSNDGLSWANAKRTVQGAIDAIESDGGEVWVAQGVYGRVFSGPFVHLLGGFSGNEISTDERNWNTHETILDGEGIGTVVRLWFPGHRVSRLDGFTIRNGREFLASGIYVVEGGSILMNNRVIENESLRSSTTTQTGALWLSGGRSLVMDNYIARNRGRYSGGGILVSSGDPEIIRNQIEHNLADNEGGAILVSGGSPRILLNRFRGNSAPRSPCLRILYPGTYGPIEVIGNTFVGHDGPAVSVDGPIETRIIGNTLAGNRSGILLSTSAVSTVANNIVAFSESLGIRLSQNSSARANCVVPDVYDGVIPSPTGMDGNISADPRFARNPSEGGDGWGDDPATPGIDEGANDDFGDLRLTYGSPCIDAGSNPDVPADTFDLDGDGDTTEPMPLDFRGRSRLFDDPNTLDTGIGPSPIVDIGAYEFTRGVPSVGSAGSPSAP